MSEEESSKRAKTTKAYTKYTQKEVETLLNIDFNDLHNSEIKAEHILNLSIDNTHDKLKFKIYDRLVDCINAEDFPIGGLENISEATLTDMVSTFMIAIVADYQKTANRPNVKLRREKTISGYDDTTGKEDYVIVDRITSKNDNQNSVYLVIVEVKATELISGLKQCIFLGLRDAYHDNKSNNYLEPIYGFITTGINWKLVKYDGEKFQLSELLISTFAKMNEEKERWMKDYLKLVDIIYHSMDHKST